MSFVIYNTEGNRREDNMESRGRGGGGECGRRGMGQAAQASGSASASVCCAESSSEGFLMVPEEPESTSFSPLVHSNLSLVFVHTGMGGEKGRMCSNRQCPTSGDKELNRCCRLLETRMIFTVS